MAKVKVVTMIGERLVTVEVDAQHLAYNLRHYNAACNERPGELTTKYSDTPMSADTRATLATIYQEHVLPSRLKEFQEKIQRDKNPSQ